MVESLIYWPWKSSTSTPSATSTKCWVSPRPDFWLTWFCWGTKPKIPWFVSSCSLFFMPRASGKLRSVTSSMLAAWKLSHWSNLVTSVESSNRGILRSKELEVLSLFFEWVFRLIIAVWLPKIALEFWLMVQPYLKAIPYPRVWKMKEFVIYKCITGVTATKISRRLLK